MKSFKVKGVEITIDNPERKVVSVVATYHGKQTAFSTNDIASYEACLKRAKEPRMKAQQTFLAYYKQILYDCPELKRNA